jgi:5-methylcytosine-specific restriction endonuclease McrA
MPEETAGTWARFCSDECRHAAADVSREKARLKNKGRGSQSHETRARRRGLPLIYSITLNKVASMDGFQCQLCGEETLPCFVRGDHRSPTIDHVVPLGNPANMMHGHTWDNVQLACWECNCRKREHVECDSLLWSTNPRELAKRIRRERGFFFVKAGGASPGNAVVRTKAPRESRANISQILKNPEATDGTPRATA